MKDEDMGYTSPFVALRASNPAFGLEYRGTLEDVLSEISLQATSSESIRALHPPRIIRAVIDYKINHPSAAAEIGLRDAIGAALELYRKPGHALSSAQTLRKKLESAGLHDLLAAPINQPDDRTTKNATDPLRSQRTAEQLVLQTKSRDVLFIALGHGGVAAGMDVYLSYCDVAKSDNSAFYVARLSTQKLKDAQPKLSPAEIGYLKGLGSGRQVVIFDEDSFSGKTIHIASAYFSSQVFPSQYVMTATNLDAKTEIHAAGFGKQLLELSEHSGFEKHQFIKKFYNDIVDKKLNTIAKKDYLYKPFDQKNIHILDPGITSLLLKKEYGSSPKSYLQEKIAPNLGQRA